MRGIERIVCPIDFSDPSHAAFKTAAGLAGLLNASLTACHVLPLHMPPLSGLGSGLAGALETDERDRLRADLALRLRAFVADVATSAPVEILVEEGNAANQIVTIADASDADLIVMATHGHGGFERLILGSTTEKTLRKARCAVLTIPPGEPGTAGFRRIVCATDFSDPAQGALDRALVLARASNGRVTLVHVLEPPVLPSPAVTKGSFDVGGYGDALEREARERLDRIASEAGRETVDAVVVRRGKVYREILEAARDASADLLAMGVHGHGALADALFGSTAYQMVRQATCPVLTARAVAS